MTVSREITKMRRTSGIAGQYAYDVEVRYTYDNGEAELVKANFVGGEHNPPVVMVTPIWGQQFVQDWKRFGEKLDTNWIRNFFKG